MAKYIDAEKLKEECKKVTEKNLLELGQYPYMRMIVLEYHEHIDKIIDYLQQEQPEVFDTVAFQRGVQEGRRLEREDAL